MSRRQELYKLIVTSDAYMQRQCALDRCEEGDITFLSRYRAWRESLLGPSRLP
jgi:hypothetical protein